MLRTINKGFTLLEVMVALAIVALSLMAVTSSIVQMIDSANIMRDRTYATWIAQNIITEYRLALLTPEVGDSNGEVLFMNRDWSWRAVVENSGVNNLYRINVEVSLEGNDNNIRTITGFIGQPSVPGLANRAWNNQYLVDSIDGVKE
tara:strand:+ start:7040 stop:7480 length:441 start_codon:yes stop_codon:yes gene_type:complete